MRRTTSEERAFAALMGVVSGLEVSAEQLEDWLPACQDFRECRPVPQPLLSAAGLLWHDVPIQLVQWRWMLPCLSLDLHSGVQHVLRSIRHSDG